MQKLKLHSFAPFAAHARGAGMPAHPFPPPAHPFPPPPAARRPPSLISPLQRFVRHPQFEILVRQRRRDCAVRQLSVERGGPSAGQRKGRLQCPRAFQYPAPAALVAADEPGRVVAVGGARAHDGPDAADLPRAGAGEAPAAEVVATFHRARVILVEPVPAPPARVSCGTGAAQRQVLNVTWCAAHVCLSTTGTSWSAPPRRPP